MSRINQIVLSCEHADRRVPSAYLHLFSEDPSVLTTHRAYDIGIMKLAKTVAGILHRPLFTYYISRLLIDPNRSLNNPDLFSGFSKTLSRTEKEQLIQAFYHPYRELVTQHIRQQIQDGRQVIHLSLHSFTPELHGQKRTADIGILYDPCRPREKSLAIVLQDTLKRITGLRLRRNYPYRGNADGFTTTLRRTYHPRRYLGIEVEFNQALLTDRQSKARQLAEYFCLALKRTFR